MKKSTLLTLVFLTVFSFSVKSQTSKKRINLPNESEVLYTVSDNSLNGPYVITNSDYVITTRGSYTNDLRTGNWYFFNLDGSVFLRYNYDLKKVLALDAKALTFANITIISANDVTSSSVPIPLMAIEEYVELLSILVKQKIPSSLKNTIDKLDVEIIADLDELGHAAYKVKYKLDNIDQVQNFDLIGQKYSISWIPASLKNVNYKSQFSFNISLNFSDQKGILDNQKRFRWN